jgi:hypothetical protein
MFLPSLNHMDGLEMITTYQETVSDRLYCCSGRNVFPERSGQGYFASGEKSRCRSRHVYVDHDTRALKDLGDADKAVVWNFFSIFERLVGRGRVGLNDYNATEMNEHCVTACIFVIRYVLLHLISTFLVQARLFFAAPGNNGS